jgi:phosphatidylinositol alpha-1,6-mannosyltransferase
MTTHKSAPGCNRIIGLFPELLGVGGIQEAGRMTAAALKEIALRDGSSAECLSLNDPPGSHAFEFEGRTISLRGSGRAKMSFVLSAIRRARLTAKGGALVILAAHPNLAVPGTWMQQILRGTKSIVMTHGIEVWKPLQPIRRRALLRANLVLGPSRDTVQRLIHVQGVAPEKTRRLPWPLSPAFLSAADAASGLSTPRGFPQEGLVILTVGRWASSERYKGADKLIGTLPQLRATFPSLNLVAVGGGDDLPRLRELAIGLGVADCVRFLENLSREEVAACYARADLFALPSTGEGFGLVFLEAMAFSKAVVGVACGGTTDVVEDGINGLLVPPENECVLAEALARLLHDDTLRSQLGRRGAEIVRRKYRFDVFQSELETILREVGPSVLR